MIDLPFSDTIHRWITISTNLHGCSGLRFVLETNKDAADASNLLTILSDPKDGTSVQ